MNIIQIQYHARFAYFYQEKNEYYTEEMSFSCLVTIVNIGIYFFYKLYLDLRIHEILFHTFRVNFFFFIVVLVFDFYKYWPTFSSNGKMLLKNVYSVLGSEMKKKRKKKKMTEFYAERIFKQCIVFDVFISFPFFPSHCAFIIFSNKRKRAL